MKNIEILAKSFLKTARWQIKDCPLANICLKKQKYGLKQGLYRNLANTGKIFQYLLGFRRF